MALSSCVALSESWGTEQLGLFVNRDPGLVAYCEPTSVILWVVRNSYTSIVRALHVGMAMCWLAYFEQLRMAILFNVWQEPFPE